MQNERDLDQMVPMEVVRMVGFLLSFEDRANRICFCTAYKYEKARS